MRCIGGLVNLFKDIFMILGIVVVMFQQCAFGLGLPGYLALIAVIWRSFRIKARQAYRETGVRLARINASFAENISGMRLVRFFAKRSKYKNLIKSTPIITGPLGNLRFCHFPPSIELVYALAWPF